MWTHAVAYLRLVADIALLRYVHREAATTLAEAHTLVEQRKAEICRLRGVLLPRQMGTSQEEAEAWL